MTRQELKQMKGYITPRADEYGPAINDAGDREFNMRVSMLRPCMAKIGPDARWDMVEDTIVEIYAMCVKNDRYYGPIAFIRTVRTYYMRKLYKERGLTARGTKPKSEVLYIGNMYDEDGNNMIETMADPSSFDEEVLQEGDDTKWND